MNGVAIKKEDEGQQGQGAAMDVDEEGTGHRPPGQGAQQQGMGAKGGGVAIKTEPSVKGEPGEPPPLSSLAPGVSAVASKGFAGANAGSRSNLSALSSAGGCRAVVRVLLVCDICVCLWAAICNSKCDLL